MSRGAKTRAGVALALAATMAIGALVQSAAAQETTGETGSQTGSTDEHVTFTWGATGEPSSLNPMSGYLAIDFYQWTPTYHMLLDYDKDFSTEPFGGFDAGLVTAIEYSDDLTNYKYTIRDDIVWSDGTPLTADDVAFTMNLYKFNHAYLPSAYLQLIDGEVRLADENTIEFDTKSPTGLYKGDAPYMYMYIVPRHVFEGLDRPKGFENVPSVGSGPFYIAEYQVGEFVRLERNEFWPGPEPAIDEIIYRIYKNDDALATALRTGEVDFAQLTTPNIFNSLQNEPNIDTMAGTIPSFSEIGLNTGSAYQEPTEGFTPHGDGHPALTDVNVRRAIRMAINSEELLEKVQLGYGVPGTTIIPPVSVTGSRWEPTGDELIAWDLEGARQLLEENGYVDSDGDGVREMPEGSLDPGRPLNFRYFVRTSEQTSVDAAPFVSEWLSEIGIATEVEAMTSGRLTDLINAGNFDLFSWGWYPDPEPAGTLNLFTCAERPPDGSTYGNNDAYYCNPEYDALYQQQLAEPDQEARMEIVQEAQKIFYDDAAYSIMWYDALLSAWRTDRFEGWVVQPEPEGDPLEGWSGPGEVWWTLTPVSAAEGGGGSSTGTTGLPAWIWAVAALIVVALAVVFFVRRRRPEEEDV
jgi:peptide/nickel transport system substrate-binding protein